MNTKRGLARIRAMKTLRLRFAFPSILAAGIWLPAPSVGACCCYCLPFAQKYEQTPAIFYGRAVSVQDPTWLRVGNISRVQEPAIRITHFEVDRVWKGPTASRIAVTSGIGNCSDRFQEGRNYLVWTLGNSHVFRRRCRCRLPD